jgi:hypothetical protein
MKHDGPVSDNEISKNSSKLIFEVKSKHVFDVCVEYPNDGSSYNDVGICNKSFK